MTANLDLALALLPVPESDPVPHIIRVDAWEPRAFVPEEYWPDHVLDLEDQVRLHEFALIDYDGNVTVQCPKCGTLFAVEPRPWHKGQFQCVCPGCLGEASAAEDGIMPPCGYGKTRLAAAQDWSDGQ